MGVIMLIYCTEEKDMFFNQLWRFCQDDKIYGLMVFIGSESSIDKCDLDDVIKSIHKPIYGGFFPEVIYKGKTYSDSALIIGIGVPFFTEVFTKLSESNIEHEKQLEKIGENYQNQTVFCFFDGLSDGLEGFKEKIFLNMGLENNYLGGGAGNLNFEKTRCVITNEGVLEDAAVMAFLNYKSGIGVAHGWYPIGEALKVTEVKENRVVSINWNNAYEMYQTHIAKYTHLPFSQENLSSIFQNYPLGITKVGSEMVVRDPIQVLEDGSIIFVGEIPVNAFVYILTGDKQALINGTVKAQEIAIEQLNKNLEERNSCNQTRCVQFLFDCISRKMFLGEYFDEEIKALDDDHLLGALTIGEIANTGKSYLELYNKTSIIAFLEV